MSQQFAFASTLQTPSFAKSSPCSYHYSTNDTMKMKQRAFGDHLDENLAVAPSAKKTTKIRKRRRRISFFSKTPNGSTAVKSSSSMQVRSGSMSPRTIRSDTKTPRISNRTDKSLNPPPKQQQQHQRQQQPKRREPLPRQQNRLAGTTVHRHPKQQHPSYSPQEQRASHHESSSSMELEDDSLSGTLEDKNSTNKPAFYQVTTTTQQHHKNESRLASHFNTKQQMQYHQQQEQHVDHRKDNHNNETTAPRVSQADLQLWKNIKPDNQAVFDAVNTRPTRHAPSKLQRQGSLTGIQIGGNLTRTLEHELENEELTQTGSPSTATRFKPFEFVAIPHGYLINRKSFDKLNIHPLEQMQDDDDVTPYDIMNIHPLEKLEDDNDDGYDDDGGSGGGYVSNFRVNVVNTSANNHSAHFQTNSNQQGQEEAEHHLCPEVWTLPDDECSHTSKNFIFEINGKKYYHPALPPGWELEVSSKNRPIYLHPEHGPTEFCPVTLPVRNVGGKTTSMTIVPFQNSTVLDLPCEQHPYQLRNRPNKSKPVRKVFHAENDILDSPSLSNVQVPAGLQLPNGRHRTQLQQQVNEDSHEFLDTPSRSQVKWPERLKLLPRCQLSVPHPLEELAEGESEENSGLLKSPSPSQANRPKGPQLPVVNLDCTQDQLQSIATHNYDPLESPSSSTKMERPVGLQLTSAGFCRQEASELSTSTTRTFELLKQTLNEVESYEDMELASDTTASGDDSFSERNTPASVSQSTERSQDQHLSVVQSIVRQVAHATDVSTGIDNEVDDLSSTNEANRQAFRENCGYQETDDENSTRLDKSLANNKDEESLSLGSILFNGTPRNGSPLPVLFLDDNDEDTSATTPQSPDQAGTAEQGKDLASIASERVESVKLTASPGTTFTTLFSKDSSDVSNAHNQSDCRKDPTICQRTGDSPLVENGGDKEHGKEIEEEKIMVRSIPHAASRKRSASTMFIQSLELQSVSGENTSPTLPKVNLYNRSFSLQNNDNDDDEEFAFPMGGDDESSREGGSSLASNVSNTNTEEDILSSCPRSEASENETEEENADKQSRAISPTSNAPFLSPVRSDIEAHSPVLSSDGSTNRRYRDPISCLHNLETLIKKGSYGVHYPAYGWFEQKHGSVITKKTKRRRKNHIML